LLEIQHLSAGYGQATEVLADVSLKVDEGSVTALMGRNGAGKTTLCRAILGLVRPLGGEVRFGGDNLTGLSTHHIARRGVAYVPQGREIFGRLTVEENLRVASRGASGRGRLDKTWDWFPALHPLRRRPASRLSGGEQQMLAVARALVTGPRLIILDEPSEGLQPSAVTSFAGTLADIAEISGVTLLLVEQNLELVRDVAATCAFLVNGRIAAEVSTSGLGPGSSEVHQYLAL